MQKRHTQKALHAKSMQCSPKRSSSWHHCSPVKCLLLKGTAQQRLQGATQRCYVGRLPWSTDSVSLAKASVMSMQSGSSSALPSLNLMTTGLPLSATTSTSILQATSSLQQVYTACDQDSAHAFTVNNLLTHVVSGVVLPSQPVCNGCGNSVSVIHQPCKCPFKDGDKQIPSIRHAVLTI